MIRKAWTLTALLLVSLATSRLTAQEQYGPPATGNTSAILFAPATLNLVAGSFTAGYGGDGGPANSATSMLSAPIGIAYDSNGNLFVADSANHVVRRIDHGTGDISTFAGQQANPGFSIGGGVATSAQMQSPSGLVVDSNNNVYVADRSNNVVFKITPAGVISIFAGSGTVGYGGDGGLATAPAAKFSNIWALGIDANNNIYVGDTANNLIRKVTQAGNLSTFAGDVADVSGCSSNQYSTGAPPYTALQVHLCFPQGVAFDSLGNGYITDTKDDVIYKVDSSGNLTLFAGTYKTSGFSGDGGPATSAWFDLPAGLYADPAGRIYISDFFSGRIRVVDSLGNINTVFGDGFGSLNKNSIGEPDTEATNVTNGPANGIYNFVLDQEGNIVATDSSSNVVTSAGSTGNYVFPEQFVFDPSLAKYVTVENPSGVPLDFMGTPTITGPYSLATGVSAGTCNFSGTLPAGETCTIGIIFTPIVDNPTNPGSLTLTTNANSSPSTITLTGMSYGTGTTSASLVGPGPSFTAVVGETSASQAATLTNSGQEPITISSTSFGGIDPAVFAIGSTTCPTSPATLASGASCVFNLTFTPTNTVTESASFNVTIANYGQIGVVLDGVGTAAGSPTAMLSSSTLNFGGVQIDTTSPPLIETVTNTGSGSLNISGVSIAQTGNTVFFLSTGANQCTSTTSLTAGQSCSVYVTFKPAVNNQTSNATLQIADNAPPSPQTAALTGVGDYFFEPVGSSSSVVPVSVFITTGGTLSATNVVTTGTHTQDYAVQSGGTCATGTAYTVGQVCTVDVIFTPQYSGARNGSIYLTDASGNVLGTTFLLGTGDGPQMIFGPVAPQSVTGYITGLAGVAVDAADDLFYVNGSDKLIEVPVSGPAVTVVNLNSLLGGVAPNNVAIDPSGNLFIASNSSTPLIEVPSTGVGTWGTPASINTGGVANVAQVATDALGNLYIVAPAQTAVLQLPLTGSGYGTPVTLPFPGGGDFKPEGVAVDLFLDVYAIGQQTSTNQTQVIYLPANNNGYGTAQTIPLPQLTFGNSVGTDGNGNLYVAGLTSPTNGGIYFVPISGAPVLVGAGLYYNFTLDGASNIFTVEANSNDQAALIEIPQATPPSLTFASTNVGATSTDSPKTITVTNVGNEQLNFYASSSYPTDFPVNNGDDNVCNAEFPLNAGAKCDVSVDFTPTVTGSLSEVVILNDNLTNGGQASQSIPVSGTATGAAAPVATLTPSLAFPSTTVGSTASVMAATLSNSGNATLNITGITIAGTNPADFALATGANACGTTLAGDASCSIYVTFTPASATSFSATLSVADNAAGSPQTSTLTGTGTVPLAPAATLAPNPVAFASQTIGATSAATTVTLTNTGNATLTITGITITGTNPTDFATTTGSNACEDAISAGASCNIYVTFTPAAAASYSATLSVADNVAGSPQTVALSGSGINPADFGVNASPASQTVQAGGSTTFNVSVASSGGTFSSPVGLTVSGLPPGATGSFSPSSVTPGSESASSTLTVQTGLTPQQTARNSAWPLAAPVLAAVGLFFIPGKRHRRWITLGTLLLASLGTLTALSGCGGGFSFVQPSQSYTLTITGTSGTDTHSTTVQLTVQ